MFHGEKVMDTTDREAVDDLALCDLSTLPKLGLKGNKAADWLVSKGITPPANRYDTGALDDGGIIARTDAHEFLLESGPPGRIVPLVLQLRSAPPVNPFHVERTDATFLIAGRRAQEVMLQTCGVNFADSNQTPRGRLVMSRVAGVSCAILPTTEGDADRFRLWLDPSFASSLWESLEAIVHESRGKVVRAGAIYPAMA